MLQGLLRSWLGDFKEGELKKFSLLSVIFCFVIGTYWWLRPLKDGVFANVVGALYQPRAKILSLLLVLPLVILYTKLLEYFPRHRMFYALCVIYGFIALIFAFIMAHPTMGLANTVTDPTRWWGWAWYIYIESFGSLMVALFWAFTTDITKAESAPNGFRLIALGGQIGNILFPLTLWRLLEYYKACDLDTGRCPDSIMVGCIIFAAVLMFSIIGLVYWFMTAVPQDQLEGFEEKKSEEKAEPGFFEGIRLLFTSPYLLGIFFLITAYEIIVTIFDFNFKVFVQMAYPGHSATTAYLSQFGFWTGVVSLLSVLLGINRIQKFIGLGSSLMLMPLLIAAAVVLFTKYQVLSILFWIMVLSKAINYALNQPTMKQLYIPTSNDAKYKSQAFIETYGSRGSKALGSTINNYRSFFQLRFGTVEGFAYYLSLCMYASFGIIGFWLVVAFLMGRTYKKAVQEKRLIC